MKVLSALQMLSQICQRRFGILDAASKKIVIAGVSAGSFLPGTNVCRGNSGASGTKKTQLNMRRRGVAAGSVTFPLSPGGRARCSCIRIERFPCCWRNQVPGASRFSESPCTCSLSCPQKIEPSHSRPLFRKNPAIPCETMRSSD